MAPALRYLLPIAIAASNTAFACMCFGPQTFCGTLNPQPPQFPDPQWWIPSDIIMAVKVNSVEYGADMKVVQTFSGTLQPEQVIRVWGDCGLLCRYYVDGVANGDTVIWGIQHTDLSGNFGCGTQFEQPSDYQLSICGVYWLGYGNGIVSGPLTEEGLEQQVTIAEFQAMVDGCLSTAVPQPDMHGGLIVRTTIDGPVIALDDGAGTVLSVFDPQGRAVLRRAWNGAPLRIEHLASGVFIVQVARADRRWIHRVLIN